MALTQTKKPQIGNMDYFKFIVASTKLFEQQSGLLSGQAAIVRFHRPFTFNKIANQYIQWIDLHL